MTIVWLVIFNKNTVCYHVLTFTQVLHFLCSTDHHLPLLHFKERTWLKALCSLDETKATGLDGVSSQLLQMLALQYPRVSLFNPRVNFHKNGKRGKCHSSAKTWRQFPGYELSSSAYFSSMTHSVWITCPSSALSLPIDSKGLPSSAQFDFSTPP